MQYLQVRYTVYACIRRDDGRLSGRNMQTE